MTNMKSLKCPHHLLAITAATIVLQTSGQNPRRPDQSVLPESLDAVELKDKLSSAPAIEHFGVDHEHELVVPRRVS